jgi:hypothetical protein
VGLQLSGTLLTRLDVRRQQFLFLHGPLISLLLLRNGMIPQANWIAFAPGFSEIEGNELYIEREDEFDIVCGALLIVKFG